ncbi:MAG TPA: hypothetical protein VNE39_14205 [Planctomycetota bacterium]|nr:hypothetical protein [Planctomycetota bacterium]
MRKEHVLWVLVFGTIWGAAEAVGGGVLYRLQVPHSAAVLAVIAFAVLSVARVYLPAAGSSTAIAACAMLYKFLNTPFFACHLLGVLMLGVAYDVFWSGVRIRNRSISAALATYLGFALFAVLATYAFQHPYWAPFGLSKVLQHIFATGSIAAVANAALVPAWFRLGEALKGRSFAPLAFRSPLAASGTAAVMAALWVLSATVTF